VYVPDTGAERSVAAAFRSTCTSSVAWREYAPSAEVSVWAGMLKRMRVVVSPGTESLGAAWGSAGRTAWAADGAQPSAHPIPSQVNSRMSSLKVVE
jgi:hypothetical protein